MAFLSRAILDDTLRNFHQTSGLKHNGRDRAAIQAYLTAIVVDAKKMARRLAA